MQIHSIYNYTALAPLLCEHLLQPVAQECVSVDPELGVTNGVEDFDSADYILIA